VAIAAGQHTMYANTLGHSTTRSRTWDTVSVQLHSKIIDRKEENVLAGRAYVSGQRHTQSEDKMGECHHGVAHRRGGSWNFEFGTCKLANTNQIQDDLNF
jgi:hypothetical protein